MRGLGIGRGVRLEEGTEIWSSAGEEETTEGYRGGGC